MAWMSGHYGTYCQGTQTVVLLLNWPYEKSDTFTPQCIKVSVCCISFVFEFFSVQNWGPIREQTDYNTMYSILQLGVFLLHLPKKKTVCARLKLAQAFLANDLCQMWEMWLTIVVHLNTLLPLAGIFVQDILLAYIRC